MTAFTLNETEEAAFLKFRRKHKKHATTFTVAFTPTGIGLAISVTCDACKKTKNITDVGSW